MNKTTYAERKARAEQKAIEWQAEFNEHNYSYSELAYWSNVFSKLAKRYGLTEVFKENGII